ncbi:MAG: diguanylate cyclase [Okeania sp. SIO2F4]|uniref:diguanylate cyclase domain-containing protein n=1 Tax=Okeania sp. SIO2F4 TaxID=2607790 RepID=UPI00142ABB1A|nr:diguanylate cyclase [Okeania sp. SIO2F4]NES04860.1 diguanylate cyclase [Okeania sp. SIO2F4]
MESDIIANNILIVDDQIPNLRVLTAMLKEKNYQVRKATDGETAIEAVEIEPPDLIILDIKMPGMDGYEVCQSLKLNDATKDIPIIFISALNEVFDKVKAFDVGGIDYITKPFQEEEVLARIKSQLTIKQQQRLLEKEKERLKQEIQKRKEIEASLYQSRALISSIVNNSLDGVAALEAVRNPRTGNIEDFRCLIVNPIMAKIFNQQSEDLIGKLVFKRFINKVELNSFDDFVGVVETGISLQKDFSYEYKGEKRWYSCIAVKLTDGFSVTVRDITERKKQELELNNFASIDSLTGISNRRIFDQTLGKEWQTCQREKQPLALIIMDIDYFKKYNDYYGHQKGDNCLIRVAQATYKVIKRPRDLVARYGGEEFAIILPNTDRKGAMTIANMVQQQIKELAIPHERSEVSPFVSVSLGISCVIPTTESSPNTLVDMADRAMYTAKQQGRNMAIAYTSS